MTSIDKKQIFGLGVKSTKFGKNVDFDMLNKTGYGPQRELPCKQQKTVVKVWRHMTSLDKNQIFGFEAKSTKFGI